MQIGYARVRTKEQSLDLQVDALRKAGCEEVYREVVNGAKAERPMLDALLRERNGACGWSATPWPISGRHRPRTATTA